MGHRTRVFNDGGLPNGVGEILEFLARKARGYNNHLKWNEVAKLKGDLMNVPDRWLVIDPQAVRERALSLGMRTEDVDVIVDLVERRKQGKRLVPQASYRHHKFLQPVTVYPDDSRPAIKPSPGW